MYVVYIIYKIYTYGCSGGAQHPNVNSRSTKSLGSLPSPLSIRPNDSLGKSLAPLSKPKVMVMVVVMMVVMVMVMVMVMVVMVVMAVLS